jgi:hypothetical protein
MQDNLRVDNEQEVLDQRIEPEKNNKTAGDNKVIGQNTKDEKELGWGADSDLV